MKLSPGGYKRIIFDVLGVLLILSGLSIGWLPGPGGIPLILAGLGLLSINNHWAKNAIKHFEKYAKNIRLLVFPNNKIAKYIHNIIAFVLFIVAIWLIVIIETAFSIGLGISCLAIAMAEILLNYILIKKIN
ncbi:MAG: PGPGW domain-containing protein [Candidatus Saccharibacteria bacterium]